MFKRDNVFNRSMMREVVLLFIAVAFIGLSSGFIENLLNNFYNTIRITDDQRMKILEPLRETPGLLIMLIVAGLSFLTIGRIGTTAMAVRAAGYILVGLFVTQFSWTLVVFMVVVSLGEHIFMPLRNSIGITVANHGYEGRVIGFMDALTTVFYILASLPLLLAFTGSRIEDYRPYFILCAITSACAGLALFFMRTHRGAETIAKPRIVLKKKYTLYYLISFISGFRKQIFILFAPWMLIRSFQQPASTMVLLAIIGSATVFFFNPFIGHLIDKFGERKLLVGGGVVCTAIYITYAFLCKPTGDAQIDSIVVIVLLALGYLDRLSQSTLMGRDIFVKHTASTPDEIMPTLSVGVSMDHVASVIGPIAGGIVWETVGHEWVFAAGAVIGLIYTAMCFLVPGKSVDKQQIVSAGVSETQ